MKKGQVTIKDIAKELNISCSTVSRALKDFPGISPNTRKAVKELADKYNYRPNAVALSLRNQRTNVIGVIIPETVHFFFSTVISGIEDEAMKEGYNVMICQSIESFEREADSIDALMSARVDGLLVDISRETSDLAHLQKVVEEGVPMVFFDRLVEGMNAPSVIVDDYQGAYDAVEHLIQQGCKDIAHLAGPGNLIIGRKRIEGYTSALEDNEMPIKKDFIVECRNGTQEEAEQAMDQLLASGKKIDGVFANNDMAALGALKSIKKAGLKIPEDIAVIGYSDWQFCSLVNPSLSSVSQPGYEMGKEACKLIFKEINKTNIEKSTIKILDTEVVVRESSNKLGVIQPLAN
ncbi:MULTISPECIES: LacI family DNA-binding transcriptional regulator [Roseivirga]|uniref:LacI family transcriptional regulator n=1 Tax=Roseivirga spongicola TaxID=333140 RepID=A0A150XF18_9BACT|nr:MULTISPECIES: LacI family DNA-binding transcriptional regulator [Roseivirga]KYG77339.1 LacI family transcriptional regulator [Roseivirga spongicola]MBO6662572.1 LacI family DNA-binding transcriptional regulator [Roseivirga sp.]MBO6909579.1 LacI family DNA-binding transcriptional regulator [Roseivirga sp.]WPZ11041.1 LacI family DNA-binding transcriptional regulator [Roseivirga spongicola]